MPRKKTTEIEMISITSLRPNPNNPRVIRDKGYRKLKNSIKDFPKGMYLKPIITDDDYLILAGNQRYEVLLDLGYKHLPAGWVKKANDLIEEDGLTPEEVDRFIIMDNTHAGEWDFEALANEWEASDLNDYGLDVWDNSGTDFEPEVNPDTNSSVVTEEDVQDYDKKEGLNNGTENKLIDAMCPECGCEFKVRSN